MAAASDDRVAAVAAFDLDGTLTDGGSVVRWLTAIGGARTVRAAIARHAVALASGALQSGHAADVAKEALFVDVLEGVELGRAQEVSTAFAAEHLRHSLRPAIASRLASHLDAGHVVVVVSASPALYVRRIAESLGAHGTAATELAVVEGRLTGRYEGANCRGTEKLRRVDALLAELGRRRRRAPADALRVRELARRPAPARGLRSTRRRLAARALRPAAPLPAPRRRHDLTRGPDAQGRRSTATTGVTARVPAARPS
jgi:phosphatidylglycerophosphatase C